MPKVRFTPDEKAKAVMRHFQDGIAISTICGELSIHPNLFYIWQKQLFPARRLSSRTRESPCSVSMRNRLPNWRSGLKTRTAS